MDPISTAIIAAITAGVTEVGKKRRIAKGAGKDLWELIKKPFTKEKDKALIYTLDNLN